MYKVDSVVKESRRLNPLVDCQCHSILQIFHADNHHLNSHNEAACQELRVRRSCGAHIPQAPTHIVPTHDLENHENSEQFDAVRFAKMRLQKDGKNFDMVATSPKFFSFSIGSDIILPRTPCELKIMLAHIVSNYDVRLEN